MFLVININVINKITKSPFIPLFDKEGLGEILETVTKLNFAICILLLFNPS
jgi:hypothetical protein